MGATVSRVAGQRTERDCGNLMGADLVCSFLEIAKDKQPDFAAANKCAEALSEEACREIVASAIQATDEDEVDERLGIGSSTAQETVRAAVMYVLEAWDESYRNTVVLELRESNLLLVADTTWGDPVEGIEKFAMFELSGAAKAAGFLTE